MSEIILAVDFGTSNSLVGAWHADGNSARIEALPLDPRAVDPTLMRTLVYFLNQDEAFYGAEAIEKALETEMEGRLFRSFKSHLPNQLYVGTFVGNRPLPLENLIGLFLLELKKRAERHFKKEIFRAVIGRPARYSMDPIADEFALHRMKKAAEFAGFKDFQFVPEPLAAAFDFRRHLKEEKIVLVADFGGGTSDFTLIKLSQKPFKKEDVLAIEGAPIAGDALDSLFMSERLNRQFGAQTQYKMLFGSNILKMPPGIIKKLNHPAHIVHLKEKDTYEFLKTVQKASLNEKDKAALARLFVLMEDQQIFSFFEHIEKTKKALSQNTKVEFSFSYPEIEVQDVFLKNEFEHWAQPAQEKIFAALDQSFQQAQIAPSQVDLVCLTGGTAQVPFIKRQLEERFGKEKLQTQSQFHSVLSGLIECAGLASAGLQF